MIFLYFCLVLLKSLSQMAFYFSNLILQTAPNKKIRKLFAVCGFFTNAYLSKRALNSLVNSS
ncbi:hypothetical protein E5341_10700 [Ligilactobacillus murinus]|nr:hypothetical protein E5341_10700 [Ligilactobacillus murinus]